MKTFKKVDLIISVLLIMGFFCWFVIEPSIENAIMSYIITGGWQVVSMVVHEFTRCFVARQSKRRVYHWISLCSLVAMPFGYAYFMVIIAPFMALFYTGLCWYELRLVLQRPLAVLK